MSAPVSSYSAPAPVKAWDLSTDASGNDATLVPFIAEMTGTSSASTQVAQLQGHAIAGIHALFECVLDASDSTMLLNAFKIRDTDASAFPNGGHNSLSDELTLAKFEVDLDASANFVDVLSRAIAWSKANDSLVTRVANGVSEEMEGDNDADVEAVGHRNINRYFAELVREMIENQLGYSGLLNLIEPSMIKSVTADVLHQPASENMRDKVQATTAVDARKKFFTQINRDVIMGYLSKIAPENHTVDFLPMKGGQSMTFVFDTIVEDPAQLDVVNVTGGVSYNNMYPNSTIGSGTLPGATLAFLGDKVKRRIGVILHLGNKNAYFGRSYDATAVSAYTAAAGSGLSQELLSLAAQIDAADDLVERFPYTLCPVYDVSDASIAELDAAAATLATAIGTSGLTNATVLATAVAAKDAVKPIGDYSAVSGMLAKVVDYNNKLAKYAAARALTNAKKAAYSAYTNATTIASADRKRPKIAATASNVNANTTW